MAETKQDDVIMTMINDLTKTTQSLRNTARTRKPPPEFELLETSANLMERAAEMITALARVR